MLLCADTSSSLGSLCVKLSDGSHQELTWEKASSHSEVITASYAQLQTQAHFHSKDLKFLAVDVGPGSFTGIRVALSFIKTLSYCFQLPVWCGDSFTITAATHAQEGKTLLALSAVRTHVYVAGFEKKAGQLTQILPPSTLAREKLEELKITYDHFLDCDRKELRPRSSDMANFIGLKAKDLKFVSWKDVQPLYLRRSEAEEKLETGLLKPVY